MLTQADKDLLIKDLCARLPYEVKCETNRGALPIYTIAYDGSVLFKDGISQFCMDNPKPYLRSMRNMTREERKYLSDYYDWGYNIPTKSIHKDGSKTALYIYAIQDEDFCFIHEDSAYELIDFLNEHHFDYRDLIEKGLALEAPEGMY